MTLFSALTVWQPWATMIAEEVKPIEFRGYAAPKGLVGKTIAIHAAARKVKEVEVRAILVQLHSDRWRETGLIRDPAIALLEKVKADPTALPLSSIVCTADMGKPLERDALSQRLGFKLDNDSDRHQHTSWGWPLHNVQRLMPPLPARGQQGWWKVAIDVPASKADREAAVKAAAALAAVCADPKSSGPSSTMFITRTGPRRGAKYTTWANLPGLVRMGDAYSHDLLPDWAYTRAELASEMIPDLERLAATGERPTTATRANS